MAFIIDGKKYDYATSEELHSEGDGQAMSPQDGRLEIYRSPKGTLWARLYYWPSETRDSETVVAGEAAVRRLIQRGCPSYRVSRVLEKVFGAIEEG